MASTSVDILPLLAPYDVNLRVSGIAKCRVLNVRTTQTPSPQARDINHLQLKTPDPAGNRTRGRRVTGGRIVPYTAGPDIVGSYSMRDKELVGNELNG